MLNPTVAPQTIRTTICVAGWTTTIRPSTTYTNRLKARQIASYGYLDPNLSSYEEDHVIALELGGAPSAASNLFPEPHSVSGTDDGLENSLHARVCAGTITLDAAQATIYAAKIAHGYNRDASLR